ncbi:hypothetical protein HELRODRAFT_113789 [Helobdella robusta]|uniref:FH2 domain-containing protein n=1 Tax=Helobdella robusta TaxID=6412 RepID=T1EFW5_HELRO|nr:hypothetical protein HELRODRAFT_113789 [Helobdella robusta]ESN98468.1 hypothetical protein HELRODRAFT_113789 [Helobdella robusta]
MESIWGRVAREIPVVQFDKKFFLQLFETKQADIKVKKSEQSKKELTILDSKRSNTINIALTSLPPVSAIKAAILKMDNNVIHKEGVEKILNTLLPTEEEVTQITEAQMAACNNHMTNNNNNNYNNNNNSINNSITLGSAENFLLTLSSINELKARLTLWLFVIEFDAIENELLDSLCSTQQAIQQIRTSRSFKRILLMLLSIGNCLNNNKSTGFTLDYLSKVTEVKDSERKHSLLHHLVVMAADHFGPNQVSDLFNEVEAVHRCARIDYDEVKEKIEKLERSCRGSWGHLRSISMHDNDEAMKKRLSSRIADFVERTIVLKTIHKRLINKFYQLLLYLGYHGKAIKNTNATQFFKYISDFCMEYKLLSAKYAKHKNKKEQQQQKLIRQQEQQLQQQLLLQQYNLAVSMASKSEVRSKFFFV